jgi:hypothetical protein
MLVESGHYVVGHSLCHYIHFLFTGSFSSAYQCLAFIFFAEYILLTFFVFKLRLPVKHSAWMMMIHSWRRHWHYDHLHFHLLLCVLWKPSRRASQKVGKQHLLCL